MSVAWQYLDKRNAAISALKDYDSMKYILAHTPSDIADIENSMGSIDSVRFSSMPKSQNNLSLRENRIVKQIDSLDVLNERYRRAQEFCAWFQPAWDGLTESERFTLSCFYSESIDLQDPIGDICNYYHIERSSAYKKKDRALTHLTLLLYGK